MAHIGWGTTLTHSRVNNIGEIISIAYAPSASYDDYEQTTTKFKTSLPQSIDSGEIAVKMYYNGNSGAEADDFMKELKSQEKGVITVRVPNSSYSCDGYVKNISIVSNVTDAVIMDVVFRLTGEFDFRGT
jgi:hypothetical protein